MRFGVQTLYFKRSYVQLNAYTPAKNRTKNITRVLDYCDKPRLSTKKQLIETQVLSLKKCSRLDSVKQEGDFD